MRNETGFSFPRGRFRIYIMWRSLRIENSKEHDPFTISPRFRLYAVDKSRRNEFGESFADKKSPVKAKAKAALDEKKKKTN